MYERVGRRLAWFGSALLLLLLIRLVGGPEAFSSPVGRRVVAGLFVAGLFVPLLFRLLKRLRRRGRRPGR
jgi:hypothetical protein